MASADFTIADVLAWARTKPADEGYSYWSVKHCAIAQFAQHAGLPPYGAERNRLERELGGPVGDAPYTFGALVSRFEALLPAKPVFNTWSTIDAYMADIELASA